MVIDSPKPPRGRPVGGGGINRIFVTRPSIRELTLRYNRDHLITGSITNSDV